MNKQELIIRTSYDKGYHVDKDGILYNESGKKIVLTKTKSGYFSFNIRVEGSKPTRSYVHKLQAYQKFGDVLFNDGVVVRHLNGNSMDNSYDNILIGTSQDNSLDRPKEQRILSASNPIYNHNDIINDRNNGLTYKEIMDKYDIPSKGTISFIVNKSLKQKKFPLVPEATHTCG